MVATTSDALAAHPRFRLSRLSGSRPVHVGGVGVMGAVGNDVGQNWALRDFQSIAIDNCGQTHVIWASDAGSAPRTYVAATTSDCTRK